MPIFSGNTTGSISQVAYNIPSEIISFVLTNKTVGAITATVYITTTGVSQVAIMPLQISIPVASSYVSDLKILLLANRSIHIVVSGSCDYFFTIEPTKVQ